MIERLVEEVAGLRARVDTPPAPAEKPDEKA
jgi:hypothetical protein